MQLVVVGTPPANVNVAGIVIADTATATASVAYKRKPEQQQELRRKQHRRMLEGSNNMYNYNYNNFGYSQKQQAKMYYNSNARQFWARAPIAITNITAAPATITTTTTTAAATATTSFNEQTSASAPAAAAAAATYDKMQRCNNNNNSNNNNSGNNSKRCTQKYVNGNIATATATATAAISAAGNATAATTAIANGYQQNNNNSCSSSNKSNATRKARYNSNSNNKRQDASATAAYNMQQKRSNVAGSDASWHRFVTSSCIEEKFLSQHNPGHRNSTSSEATSEDINSSDEHPNKGKNRSMNGHSGNNTAGGNSSSSNSNKSRSKRQQKSQSVKQALNRTTLPTPVQGQVQPLEVQQTIKVTSSKCKQGKWRNSNNININNNNNNSSSSNMNQKRSSSNNNKAKQTKCNSNTKTGGNNSSSSSSSNGNNNSSNIVKSSGSYCGNNSSNSSSALSSPGSSPNSSSSSSSSCSLSSGSISSSSISSNISSSGNSSSGSHNISVVNWQREERQLHKAYRQNVNFLVPPLRQYERLELDDATLQQQLQRYLIEPHLLRVYGFPVESVVHEGAIEIFKCLPHMNFAAAHGMAVTETALTVINCHDGLNTSNFEYTSQEPTNETIEELECSNENSPASTSTDSGNISPRSLDSESGGEWSGSECESSSPSGLELYCNYAHMERSLAKQCVRCKHDFLVDELSGQYLTREECSYHWGKYHRCYDGNAWVSRWTCCNASDESDTGCTRHELHVWTGSVVGVNGPYRDFVHTRPRLTLNRNRGPAAVYALDCEMSYTGRGLDVTKVSLVALNGQLVYEHYVRPDADIVDYNTRYSGVTAKDLKSSGVKTLAEVQRDLLELIDADTILIGHGLDNDLRALRLVHNTLIDTSIAFPHSSGFPYRRALRHLTKTHLNREIQSGDGATGHSSFEDSRACMELMLWRVRCELDSDGSWED